MEQIAALKESLRQALDQVAELKAELATSKGMEELVHVRVYLLVPKVPYTLTNLTIYADNRTLWDMSSGEVIMTLDTNFIAEGGYLAYLTDIEVPAGTQLSFGIEKVLEKTETFEMGGIEIVFKVEVYNDTDVIVPLTG